MDKCVIIKDIEAITELFQEKNEMNNDTTPDKIPPKITTNHPIIAKFFREENRSSRKGKN